MAKTKALPKDWREFLHPESLYWLRFPPEWEEASAKSPEASFAAVSDNGLLLFEIISMNVGDSDLENFEDSVDLIGRLLADSLRDSHPDFEIQSNERVDLPPVKDAAWDRLPSPPVLERPKACRRMVCTYSDPMEFTQECYILNRDASVLACNFKVVSSEYSGMEDVFRKVAGAVRA